MPLIIYKSHDGNTQEVHAEVGTSIMQAAVDNGIDGIIGSGHAADKRFGLFFYGRSANAHAGPSVSEIKQLHGSVSETER